ncbi:L,D-transpeptidase Cds6 family protein [Propionivibrio sp.]|uniref:L,D-transpeptidase Cds6 family protein n=1 Tax=Propionivibrio sp. TaxID=2212460 RepID=UPI003BF1B6AC
MRPNSLTPSLARLSAIILGLVLSASVSVANAQTLPDVQRLMKQGQMPQALEKVDIYISTKPKDAQGRFLKGLILTEMGRPADAIAMFTKLTEDFPELPEPYNNLAVLYAQQKQYDKARTALEMAIRTHPSYSIAHENLGDVYAKLASQAYDKALQLDSTNTATQTKLSMIKELISTSSKPGVKPSAVATRPASEPVKTAAVEAPKPTPATTPVVTPPIKPAEKAPEPTVAAIPPEAKTPVEKQPLATGSESEVSKALQGWASAWSRKDVKSYLSYYASDFQTPKGVARKAWEAERTQRIDKPGKLLVSLDDIYVSIAGDKATVRFRQHYTSATLKSSASKTMVFVKSGGKWLIQQERVS